ncbi:MAG: preprotein translocase subunit SecA [Patescibacteria group bacterium]
MFKWFEGFADSGQGALKKAEKELQKVNAFEEKIVALSDDALKAKTLEFKERYQKEETLDDLLPEAFAVVREAAKRFRGERHYDVQIIGGIVLHRRGIAEMKTGEGKTLVATLPVYLNAISAKGVHVITVNDYLSRRDAVWMGEIYSFLGLSVGVLNHDSSFLYDPKHGNNQQLTTNNQQEDAKDEERDKLGSFKVMHEFLRPVTRKEAYQADITYGTNSEFGFDYLRDNLEYSKESLRQRPHAFAVVDEIDSILIDEARTPLIISAPSSESAELYNVFAKIARQMKKDEDFLIDEKLKAITLTDEGINKAEKTLGVSNIYTEKGIKYVHHLETAIKASALFEKDKEYVVKNDEIIIVDEFTGRLQPGRRWSEGLHQAIEAKEGVSVQKESRTFASITYQNYFRLYEKLSGMTGTALTSSEEFYKVYGLEVVAIPTNRPSARMDFEDQIFQTEKGKLKAIASRVKDLHQKGQPVLIGTVSIEKNELLSAYLKQEGIPHEILNAKNHEREGEIIAQAGKKGQVTIATNMAGRGVDIKLGGNPATNEEYEEVKKNGGLFVLGTERHEARRIDNQLRGRSARQGDSGATQFFVSLEDSLMRVFASDTIKNMMGRFGIPEDQPIENRLITRSLESAQTKIEGFHFDSRKHILEYDDILNHQRTIMYSRRRDMLLGENEAVDVFLEQVILGDENLAAKVQQLKQKIGAENFYLNLRRLVLQTIDLFWIDHLEAMDYLRSSVNLRAYGQRDPLVEYKKEGLKIFKEMEEGMFNEITRLLPILAEGALAMEKQSELTEVKEGAESITSSTKSSPDNSGIPKVGRNEQCPCGSGKKYKHCHGK